MRTRITNKAVADFPVTAYQLAFANETNEKYISGDRGFAIVRTDSNEIIKCVKSNYILIRHAEIFRSFESTMEKIGHLCELHDIILFGEKGSSVAIRYILQSTIGNFNPFIQIINTYNENEQNTIQLGLYEPESKTDILYPKTFNIIPKLTDGLVTNGVSDAVGKMMDFLEENTDKIAEELMLYKTTHIDIMAIKPDSAINRFFKTGREASAFYNSKILSSNHKIYGDTLDCLIIALAQYATHVQTLGDKLLYYQDQIIPFVKKNYKQLKEAE